ncbi:DNA double-strand break repair nuclease NurA [bacterium]|nr:MAG: DNA double-strand break repair nuclease NurA [bacterium]
MPVGARTVVFQVPINGTQDYPSVLVPCFFYLNSGHEVVRVEIPFWIASDQSLVSKVVSIIWDQVEKGRGYPLVLAEAHEQAVVKTEDRAYFYAAINQYSKDAHSGTSQKQRHKQQMFY